MTSGSILTGPAIAEAVQCGRIEIEGFTPARLNPASYDLTLGENVSVYASSVTSWPKASPDDGSMLEAIGRHAPIMDALKPSPVRSYKIDPVAGWVLKPHIGYLMHTAERIHTDHYIPVLDGKSTIGRLFIQVHVTAGYIDPGFTGQITLEVIATHPIRVYPGMRICQIRFHTPEGEVELYKGRYRGERSQGAVAAEVSGLKC